MAMMNDYDSMPPNAGNDAEADEEYGGAGGEKSVTCLHVYLMGDGTYRVKEATGEAVPEGAEPVEDLAGVMQRTEEYFSQPTEGDEEAMAAAKEGYGKPREMTAPNPGGLFGE